MTAKARLLAPWHRRAGNFSAQFWCCARWGRKSPGARDGKRSASCRSAPRGADKVVQTIKINQPKPEGVYPHNTSKLTSHQRRRPNRLYPPGQCGRRCPKTCSAKAPGNRGSFNASIEPKAIRKIALVGAPSWLSVLARQHADMKRRVKCAFNARKSPA